MRWLRKWFYLILLVGMGIAYLVYVDDWQVYAKPLERVRNWYESAGGGKETLETWLVLATGSDGTDSGQESIGMGDPKHIGVQSVLADGVLTDDGSEGEKGMSTVDGTPMDGSPEEPEGQEGDDPEGQSDGDASEEEPGEPVFVAVDDDYFSDALFIGDSRTVGLSKYSGLGENATFYASTGLTVYKMFEAKIVSVPGEQKKITVEEALQQNTFSKIYLMIGINEMGTGTVNSFLDAYYKAVLHLQELQPDAIIYLQGIMKVTTKRSDQGDYITNLGIETRNVGISVFADNQKTFYLDVNPFLCDENGGLISDYTSDGVHLKAKYYEIWEDYLKTHAISS